MLAAAALLWLMMPLPVQATDWESRLDQDGISVYARSQPGKAYKEFRATMTVAALPASILALLQDNAACPEWLYRCETSALLEEVSNTERYFYQVTDLPFPARSRDAVFHALLTYQQDGGIRVNMTAVEGRVPISKHVRIRDSSGTYLIEPVGENKTRVTWQQYIDPAGALPAWLVNSMLTDMPYRSLAAMRLKLLEEPYRNARFRYDDDRIPAGIIFLEDDRQTNRE